MSSARRIEEHPRARGRYVALISHSALFHLEADRWPGAVDVAAVGRFAEAATTIVMKLASAG